MARTRPAAGRVGAACGRAEPGVDSLGGYFRGNPLKYVRMLSDSRRHNRKNPALIGRVFYVVAGIVGFEANFRRPYGRKSPLGGRKLAGPERALRAEDRTPASPPNFATHNRQQNP